MVTGETGAGKTMVVTGLGLLFGGRADPRGSGRAPTRPPSRARSSSSRGGRVAQQVEDAGGELEDGELIISRSVSAEGRSRAWLGGRTVPVGTLTYLADDLVAVHGQTDQQRLLQPGRQRAALDRYAGDELVKPLRAYTQAYQRHKQVAALLDELTTRARERAQEADLLRFGLEEIEKVDPKAGRGRASCRRGGAARARRRAAHAPRPPRTRRCSATRWRPRGGAHDVISLLGEARTRRRGGARLRPRRSPRWPTGSPRPAT